VSESGEEKKKRIKSVTRFSLQSKNSSSSSLPPATSDVDAADKCADDLSRSVSSDIISTHTDLGPML
jgi:hypothetical protein